MMGTNNTRQATWVALGRFLAYAVGILTPMVFSRFFSKGDYGTYKQVMYVYSTLLVVFMLGLPQSYSYFIPKHPLTKSKDIINKITLLFTGLGVLFSAFLFFGAGVIAVLLKNPDLEMALKVFSPAPLLLLPTMGLDGIFASFKRTHLLAVYTIVTKILTVVCMVVPVVCFGGNYIHAIIGFDIASLATFIIALLMRNIPVRGVAHEKSDVSYRDLFKFAIPLFYASIWGVVIASANQFFVSRYYGNEVFADFSNGYQELPFAAMVVAGIGTVLFPLFSGMDKGGKMTDEIYATWNSSLVKSAKIIFPMLVFSVFFARLVMTCLYSNVYSASTVYFQIKNIGSLLYIIPFSPIILAIGKTRQYANVHLAIAILIVLFEYIAVKVDSGPVMIAVISELCQFLKIYLLMRIVSDYSGMSISRLIPGKNLGIILLASCIAGVLSFLFIRLFDANKFLLLFLALVSFCIIYYALCWAFGIRYRKIASDLLGKFSASSLIKLIP